MPFAFPEYERVPGVGDEEYNHADPIMRMRATEQRMRDQFVAVEVAKIAREKLRMCYRKETVNHTQNCADLVADYMKKQQIVTARAYSAASKGSGDDE